MDAVIDFIDEQFDQPIGQLRAQVLLDFFVKLVGHSAYNAGVADAQAYMQLKLADMPIDVYEDVQYHMEGPDGA